MFLVETYAYFCFSGTRTRRYFWALSEEAQKTKQFAHTKQFCTHKTITSYVVILALSLLLSCKLPARLVTHWQKVRGNVIPLVGFGDLQPLFVLAKMKFIWRVAQKDRWNAGSHSSSCWEAIVFLVSELLYREAHLTSLWEEGTSPFTYFTATKCRLQTNQS